MRDLRGTYVHRGDVARRRRRIKQSVFVVGFFFSLWFIAAHRKPELPSAEAAVAAPQSSFFSLGRETKQLRRELENAKGELSLLKGQYERVEQIMELSSRYAISGG